MVFIGAVMMIRRLATAKLCDNYFQSMFIVTRVRPGLFGFPS
jgi:hypothetical protein